MCFQDATSVSVYFPGGRWFDWYSHEVLDVQSDGEFRTRPAPADGDIPILVRGGQVLAKKKDGAANTTTQRCVFLITTRYSSRCLLLKYIHVYYSRCNRL